MIYLIPFLTFKLKICKRCMAKNTCESNVVEKPMFSRKHPGRNYFDVDDKTPLARKFALKTLYLHRKDLQ